MTKLKQLILGLSAFGLLLVPAAAPASVSAQIQENLCQGANLQVGEGGADCQDTEAEDSINSIITTVINIFSLIVGVVSVIMIIIGGLKYITSGGDSNNVTSAKNTILYAIIGLIVVALAQIIVQFVLSRATSGV